MKVTDVVKLALAGKTPGEISELMELEKKVKESAPDPEPEKADPEPEPEKNDPTPTPEKADPAPAPAPDPEQPDYKALYEQTLKDLKAAQAINNKGAMDPEQDPEKQRQDIITNIVRDFM